MSKVEDIPLCKIVRGLNDRTVFDLAALQELAESIREHGLIQPITVRPLNGGYELIAGERRYRAVQLLNLTVIPAVVRDVNDETAAALMLAENTSRKDLNPIDEARAYRARQSRFNWSFSKIAQVAGVSTVRVSKMLSLLQLADDIQCLVATGQLSLTYAALMVDLDVNRQHATIRFLNSAGHVSVPAFRMFIECLIAEQAQDTLFDLADLYAKIQVQAADFERQITFPLPASPLPGVDVKGTNNTATIILRWMRELEREGFKHEAGVVAVLYNVLKKGSWIRYPKMQEV